MSGDMIKMVGMATVPEAMGEKRQHPGESLSLEWVDMVHMGQESVSTGTMSLVTMATTTVAQQCTIDITPIGDDHLVKGLLIYISSLASFALVTCTCSFLTTLSE